MDLEELVESGMWNMESVRKVARLCLLFLLRSPICYPCKTFRDQFLPKKCRFLNLR